MKMVSRKAAGQRRVYDIEVEGVHNFYANGVNVHNCATDGGVSVIKDDGTVVDLTRSTDPMDAVVFNKNGVLVFTHGAVPSTAARAWYYKIEQLTSDIALNISVQSFVRNNDITDGTTPYIGDWYTGGKVVVSGNEVVGAANQSSRLLYRSYLSDFVDNPNHMVVLTTSTYNTGWMNGDIKGAFLSDTDDTDLVGSGELVTNGTFDTDTSGWTAVRAILSVDSGHLKIDNDTEYGTAYQEITTVPGKKYVISANFPDYYGGGQSRIRVGTAPEAQDVLSLGAFNPSTFEFGTFIAETTTTYINLFIPSPNSGAARGFDNVSVRRADNDRSVNNNGLIVNGTVTREPVAPGADLVAYSGFSSTNYLEQPYNSDFDFGTGDFCIMGWVKRNAAATSVEPIVTNAAFSSGVFLSNGYYLRFGTANELSLIISDDAFATNDKVEFTSWPVGSWSHFAAFRNGSSIFMYVNGKLVQSTAITNATGSISSGERLKVGKLVDNVALDNGSLALMRVSKTAPTDEQIEKIYNDEKFLFQENAQATLYGNSDAVTALAHDEVTDLLHVGTSDGRSVFQGLRRVDNTTNGVNVIDAHDSMIIEG